MKPKDTNTYVRLGAFVLMGLVLFVVSIFYIGSENNIFIRTFTISAIFRNVEGLKEGDNVWLSGVKIGTVSKVQIVEEGKVIVSLALKNKQNEFIRRNATASIGSDGLVGNKIVVIRPGDAPQIIQDKDTINSRSPTDTQELFNIARDVGENTRTLTADLKTIASKINKGEGVVGELLNNGQLAQDIRAAVAGFSATSQQTTKASTALTTLLNEMQEGDGLFPALVSDTAYVASFQSALANIVEVSKNASRVAQELELMMDNVNNSENALGVVLSDSAFARNLRNTMINARDASAKLDENMEALQHNFLLRGYFRKKDKVNGN